MNETAAKKAGLKYTLYTEDFKDNDRSLAEGEVTGKIKMLLDEKEKPLGVQILGPGAGNLISEWVAVLNGKVKLSTIAAAIHPYPTIGEINKRVAGDYLCNLACKHCHLSAGPGRKENMDKETVQAVIDSAKKGKFSIIDITGGAPEMNPHLTFLIDALSRLSSKIILRSNLTAIRSEESNQPMEVLKAHQVSIVASFPSINEAQLNAQRGDGTFSASVDTFKKLNELGYGKSGSGLELNLVSNPTGAFLPPDQEQTEKRFRQVLKSKWGIVFNSLLSLANVPLGRFRLWLEKSGNRESLLPLSTIVLAVLPV